MPLQTAFSLRVKNLKALADVLKCDGRYVSRLPRRQWRGPDLAPRQPHVY